MKTLLFVDRDPEICAMVEDIAPALENLRVQTAKNLGDASRILYEGGVSGLVIDGMFFSKNLLDFLTQLRFRDEALPIAVLVVGVDMILDPNFIDALKHHRVRITPKTEAFSSGENMRKFFQTFLG